jgi:Uma2 family endonuclease
MATQVLPDVPAPVPGAPDRVCESFLPRIGPESAGMLMTPEEFDGIESYDELYRYELIHGVLVVNPIPSAAEVGPNELLGRWLGNYGEEHVQGKALDATLPERYVRTTDNRRRADRVIWAGLGRVPNPATDVPTIVVEFVSAGRRDWRRDYMEKRREYREVGVREYWIIDRFRRTLTVYRNQHAGETELVIAEGDVYRTDLLPGFELPLARLLAAADQWTHSP